jgi:hypothetical protein
MRVGKKVGYLDNDMVIKMEMKMVVLLDKKEVAEEVVMME